MPWLGGFTSYQHAWMCACVRVCVCACVCMHLHACVMHVCMRACSSMLMHQLRVCRQPGCVLQGRKGDRRGSLRLALPRPIRAQHGSHAVGAPSRACDHPHNTPALRSMAARGGESVAEWSGWTVWSLWGREAARLCGRCGSPTHQQQLPAGPPNTLRCTCGMTTDVRSHTSPTLPAALWSDHKRWLNKRVRGMGLRL